MVRLEGTQYGHFPWKNDVISYYRYMYNKDASGDEACLMFSKGGWIFFCQLSWDQMFFKDAASMEDFVRSCDRTMMPVSIIIIIIIIIVIIIIIIIIINGPSTFSTKRFQRSLRIPKIRQWRIDRSDWKFYELCLEAMPMHYILSFLTFWICCRCCYVSQFSVVDVDRLFCISNLRWGKQTAAVPRVQQTQPVENAALWFALMSVLFYSLVLVLIWSEKSSTLSSLLSESTSSLSRG